MMRRAGNKGDRVKLAEQGLELYTTRSRPQMNRRTVEPKDWRGRIIGEGRPHFPETVRVKWDHLKTVQTYAYYFIEKA